MKKIAVLITVLAVFITACAPIIPGSGISTPVEITSEVSTVIAETPGAPPTDGPSPTSVPPTPIPTLSSSTISPTELKYRVLDHFPDFFFCDPDYYPIAREDEMVLAQQRFPELQANQEEFHVILSRNGLSGVNTFTDEQKLLIYRDHKKLNAIYFELVGDKFQFQIQTGTEEGQGFFITGTIDGDGSIEIQQRDPSFVTCPICLAAGTRIDTPHGQIAVEDLEIGDLVWTLDASGKRIQATITITTHVAVPASHRIVHVILNDGRDLWV